MNPKKNLVAIFEETYLKTGSLFEDRYEILELLGKGAAGVVYKAFDSKTTLDNKMCAIKIFNDKFIDEQKTSSELNKEIEKLEKLEYSKNVIKFIGSGKFGKVFYIVMELVENGSDLNHILILKNNIIKEIKIKMIPEEFVYYFKQFAKGMDIIQKEKIIHKDLKPQNILINKKEILKVSDFGISELTNDLGSQISKEIPFAGTPRYCSPEQLAGINLDIRSDVYSFGIIMYEAITGTPIFDPFELNEKRRGIPKENVKAKNELLKTFYFRRHSKRRPIRPNSLFGYIPVEIDNIISKCLIKDTNRRYASFGQIYNELSQIDLNKKSKLEIIDFGSNLGKKFATKSDKKEKFLKNYSKNFFVISIIILVLAVLFAIIIISI